mmetsp:Transcript_15270/g.27818  ORF Transcript_15270/g.27818 Transcript_15270/m.27818 type:complete len:318 (-) Transcript_15270:316-1269(-)
MAAPSMALEGLEAATESIFFTSHGPQADSERATAPSFKMPKATREGRHRTYISKNHQQDSIGKTSPGFEYTPARMKSDPSWTFGKGAARPHPGGALYPESCNDLLRTIPDARGDLRKKTEPRVMIGAASRNAPVNAPDLEGFPRGGESPGPLRYNTEKSPSAFRLSWAPDIDKSSPKFTIRKKTKIPAACSQTPERVGPGAYPVPEAYGAQWKSEKPSRPSWSMNRSERWREPVQHGDAGRLWDAHGDVKMKYNRRSCSAPSFSFGNGPRVAKKVGVFPTDKDKGPVSFLPRPHQKCPELPLRRDVIKLGPAGAPMT